MRPPKVDVFEVLSRRVDRLLAEQVPPGEGVVRLADSRSTSPFAASPKRFSWVVTSPPYYGLRTYPTDQWLRQWFLGGTSQVDYQYPASQLTHDGEANFAKQLRTTWRNAAAAATPCAKLVCRFGSINDRRVDAGELIKESLRDSGWRLQTITLAGTAHDGRRQADQFARTQTTSRVEIDAYAIRE
jgi:hypothetical protein